MESKGENAKGGWIRHVPLAISIFILLDVMAADLILLKQPALLYSKLAWLELILITLLIRYWPWPLVGLFVSALLGCLATWSFQVLFSSFPIVILMIFWLAATAVAHWRKSRALQRRETGEQPS